MDYFKSSMVEDMEGFKINHLLTDPSRSSMLEGLQSLQTDPSRSSMLEGPSFIRQ